MWTTRFLGEGRPSGAGSSLVARAALRRLGWGGVSPLGHPRGFWGWSRLRPLVKGRETPVSMGGGRGKQKRRRHRWDLQASSGESEGRRSLLAGSDISVPKREV